MWTKTVIIDESAQSAKRPYNMVFAGFSNTQGEWVTKPENAKLYDTVDEAVSDARKLQLEFPVSVCTYTIDEKTGRVLITKVSF